MASSVRNSSPSSSLGSTCVGPTASSTAAVAGSGSGSHDDCGGRPDIPSTPAVVKTRGFPPAQGRLLLAGVDGPAEARQARHHHQSELAVSVKHVPLI